jgi:molybdopterin synthase sulfur carrier subunit
MYQGRNRLETAGGGRIIIAMITVLYFARLRETLGTGSEQMALPADVNNLENLRAMLATRGGAWAQLLAQGQSIRAAVNQDIAQDDTRVADGDEIAFFPPVTGG